MTNSDNLLKELIKRVNGGDQRFDVTLTIGGVVITGKITPRMAWLEANIGVLTDLGSKFSQTFADAGGVVDGEEYLHLTEAKAVLGAEPVIPVGAGFLRVATAEVGSWSIGSVDIASVTTR